MKCQCLDKTIVHNNKLMNSHLHKILKRIENVRIIIIIIILSTFFLYLKALKRKLQTRRSLKQLVDVGIMPPPKAPLPFYEQRKQLQMRKVRFSNKKSFFKKYKFLLLLDTRYA